MHRHPIRIYRVTPDGSASRFRLVNPDEFFARYPQAFRTFPMCGMNHTLPDQARATAKSFTDFGWLMSGALVWTRLRDEESHYAVESDILGADCEFVPLIVADSDRTHVALNPPLCNALDIASSDVTRDDDGRILGIQRYVFAAHRLSNNLFRLPCGSPWEIFTIFQINAADDLQFSDLRSAYVKLGLKGLTFTPVWEGEIER